MEFENYRFTIDSVNDRRIEQITMQILPIPDEEDEDGEKIRMKVLSLHVHGIKTIRTASAMSEAVFLYLNVLKRRRFSCIEILFYGKYA